MARWVVDGPQRITTDEPVRRLQIDLVSARVNVVGVDGPARVEVTRIGRKPLIVTQEAGVLRLRHDRPIRWPGFMWWLGGLGRRYHAEVSVAVPRETLSEMCVVSGSVVASGLRADATVTVTSGRITMLGLVGRICATVVSGSIEALGVGGDLRMEAVSGDITLADSTAERVSARAISGAVTCDLDNPHGSDIRLETTSGEITVRVREDSDLDVLLHATSGRTISGFHQLRTDGMPAGSTVRGRLGAGTGRVHATAVSGNISLLPRPVEHDAAEADPAEPTTEERA